MSWIDPLRRLIRPVTVRQAEPRPQPEEPEPAPLEFGMIAQSSRILKRAHIYRQQLQREAEGRAREEAARAQREREARQLAWEDHVARSLAARWSHFPGEEDEAREPGPQVIPLEAGGAGPWGRLVSFDEWARQGGSDYLER